MVGPKESIRGRQPAMGGGVREADGGPKIYDFQKEFVLEKSMSKFATVVPYCPRQPTHGPPLTPPNKSGPPPTMGI